MRVLNRQDIDDGNGKFDDHGNPDDKKNDVSQKEMIVLLEMAAVSCNFKLKFYLLVVIDELAGVVAAGVDIEIPELR